MPGMKRKASRASPYEPYSKLTKERTHSAVDPLKRMTTTRITPAVAKWPSLKRSTTKNVPTPGGSEDASPPGLRRAPTLTLVEYSSSSTSSSLTGKRTLSKKSSLVVGEVITSPSLPMSASVVDGDDVLTTLTRLSSGASIGRTTSFSKAPSAIVKELSKPSSPSTTLVAKSISRGGSIVLDVGEKPSLSTSSSRAKSVSLIGDPEAAVSLEKVASLVKALSKPSLTKEKSASIIAAAAEEAAEEAEEAAEEAEEAAEKAEEAAAEGKEEGDDGVVTRDIPLPPGGLMEMVISFDTTGSMYSCLDQVRTQIQDMVQRLQADIPGIRIAIFAHGDYCDKDNYIVQWIDFGASITEICKFVREVKKTSGGDIPEAYELVLRRCQTVLSWTPGSQRSLIMIGDAIPHEANEPQNTERIDWQTECLELKASGVRIYAVQARNKSSATSFYRRMAELTSGRHLNLSQFSDIFHTIMAICYRERGDNFLQAYELEVRGGKGGSHLGRDLEGVFGTLNSSSDTGLASSKHPVLPILKTAKKTAKKRREASTEKTKNKRNRKGARKTTAGASRVKVKTKDPKVKKIRREMIKDTHDPKYKTSIFRTENDTVKWTDWKTALVFWKPRGDSTMKKRPKGSVGFVKSNLFKGENDVRAIYEFGIRYRLAYLKRVYPMYFRHTSGFKNSIRWDRCLLANDLVKQEINSVLQKDGILYMRRGLLKDTSDKAFKNTCKYITDTFDYAWNNPKKGSTQWPHRKVVRNGQLWSGNECKRKEPKPKAKLPAKKVAKLAAKKTAKLVSKKAKVAIKKGKPGDKKTKPVSKKTKEVATNAKAAAKKKAKMAAKKAKAAAKKTKPAAKKTKPASKKNNAAVKNSKRTTKVAKTTKKTKPAIKVKSKKGKKT